MFQVKKSKFVAVSILIFSFLVTPVSVWAFDYSNFLFQYTSGIQTNLKGFEGLFTKINFGNIFTKPKQTTTQTTKVNNVVTNNESVNEVIYSAEPEVGNRYNDLNTTKKITTEIESLVITGTVGTTSISSTCGTGVTQSVVQCKQNLFISCAESLYARTELAPECSSFPAVDYQKYINSKVSYLQTTSNNSQTTNSNPFLPTQTTSQSPQPVNTSVGQVTPSLNEFSTQGSVQNSAINQDRTPLSNELQVAERSFVEPTNNQNFTYSNTNTLAPVANGEWVEGWGTLFAVRGGRSEAGQRMNARTAFGYNPYLSTTCIVSLPYKTVDRFFGTTIDACVKSRDRSCLARDKAKVKNRAIEVLNPVTNQRGVFPLGDFGPAEWTGNAIDFTKCSGDKLGITGKNKVRFRPAPQSTVQTN